MRVLAPLSSPRWAALALMALVPLTGCGGSDPLTADEFRAAADEICADYQAQLNGLEFDPDAENAADYLAAGVLLEGEQVDALAALSPPEALAEDVDAALDAWRDRAALMATALEELDEGDPVPDALEQLSDGVKGLAETGSEHAAAIGLEECAVIGGGAAADPVDDEPVPAYLRGVNNAAAALTDIGATLGAASDLNSLAAQAGSLSRDVDAFERAIGSLDDLSLAVPRLEQQRTTLIDQAGPLAARLGRFVAAARERDTDALRDQLPELSDAVAEFRAAATDT